MKKRCILLAGHSLASDQELYEALQKIAVVVKSAESSQVETLMATRPIAIVIFEVSPKNPVEIELITDIKAQFPNTIIIVVDGDGDREVIARAFSYGAKDAFRKPYNRALMVERVKVLLNCISYIEDEK